MVLIPVSILEQGLIWREWRSCCAHPCYILESRLRNSLNILVFLTEKTFQATEEQGIEQSQVEVLASPEEGRAYKMSLTSTCP